MTKNRLAKAIAPAPEAAHQQASPSETPPVEVEPEEDIHFTPVPVRARRDGWTPERQREFIRALRRIGSASTAARTVGMSARSVHKLLERPDAESFSAACDEAMEHGYRNVHDHVIDRALNGAVVPRFYKGRQTGVVHRFYDSVSIAVLSGGGASLKHRLKQAEERGARRSYFNIERKVKELLQDLNWQTDRRIAAEDKLRRLVQAGVIGPSWLECDTPWLPEPPAAPPQPEPQSEPRHHIPRIRLL